MPSRREKHGWLGDSQVTAEEAMYNLDSKPVFELFLDLILSEQERGDGNQWRGSVPAVVPMLSYEVGWPDDISWTACRSPPFSFGSISPFI